MKFETPVAFIIFNRPELTSRVFAQIAQVRPRKLYIIADGPRSSRSTDSRLCQETRDIVSKIDWPCEIKQNYSDVNLGCKSRFSTGLKWVFENEEEAIVLEDDTLPNLSFFSFCNEVLKRYKDDSHVMHITGNNFQKSDVLFENSYYFSRYPHIWGWATWRRAWQHYDVSMTSWPEIRDNKGLTNILADFKASRYWSKIFESTYNNEIDSWAYRWVLACWLNQGLTVVPKCNLVSHIGSGSGATHVKSFDRMTDRLPTYQIKFPLKHPPTIVRDEQLDRNVDRNIFRIRGLVERALMKMAQAIGRPI